MSEPVTKQDLLDLEARLNERFDVLKRYVDERCETVETHLLTEFHRWASPAEARRGAISAALRAIDLEMESLSGRVNPFKGDKPQ